MELEDFAWESHPPPSNLRHRKQLDASRNFGGQTVSLYGVSYGGLYVGANGYITFTAGDTDNTPSLEDHFNVPRISGLFYNLDPSAGGSVSWKQLADRVALTYLILSLPSEGTLTDPGADVIDMVPHTLPDPALVYNFPLDSDPGRPVPSR